MKSRLGAAGMALLVMGTVTFAGASTAQAASKVTICHRTHSTTNPYRKITVAQSATVAAGQQRNHSHHTGPVFDPGYAYPPNAKVWGDIIPFSTTLPAGVTCAPLTAAEFYNVEREAGQSHAAVVADLTEQEADADIAAGMTDFSTMSYSGTWSEAELATAERAANGDATTPPDSGEPPTGTPGTTDPSEPGPGDTTGDGSDGGTGGTDPEPDVTPTDPPSGEAPPDDPAPTDPTPTDPTTDPTPPPADPTPTDPPPPAGAQRIDGTVWLDLDRDGKRGRQEVGVPGARVQLFRLAPATVAAARTSGSAGTNGLVALALAPSSPGAVDERTTDANGAFAFPDLPTGTYRVAAARPEALTVTFDGDDELDAASEMDLPVDGHGIADVGLVGDSTLDVRTVTTDGRPLDDGGVVVRWAGLDGALGTDDDVALPAEVLDGEVRLAGLPAGTYRVERTGGALASQPLQLGAGAASPRTATLAEADADPVGTPDPTPAPDPVGTPVPPADTDPVGTPDPTPPTDPAGSPAAPGNESTGTPTTEPTAGPASYPVSAPVGWSTTRQPGNPTLTPPSAARLVGSYPAARPRTLAATGAAPQHPAWAAGALTVVGGAMLVVRRRLTTR